MADKHVEEIGRTILRVSDSGRYSLERAYPRRQGSAWCWFNPSKSSAVETAIAYVKATKKEQARIRKSVTSYLRT